MKFVVSSGLFSQRLQMVGRVIANNNILPILDSFLFEIENGQMKITASDGETTLCSTLQLQESEGNIRFAIPAKTIQDAMKELPEQPLDFYIKEDDMKMTIVYSNGEYNFMAQAADEYPEMPKVEDGAPSLQLNREHLLSAVNRAFIACANDTLRPVMNGIYFDIKPENLVLVASDGHKLACNTIHVSNAQEGSFILPKKPAGMLKNILGKGEEGEEVRVAYNGTNAEFHTGSFYLSCRLIDGKYPAYESVIPKENPNRVTVNREALIAALRRVLIFSNAASSLVRLQIEDNAVDIRARDLDFAMSAQEKISSTLSGSPLSIGFKGPFLLELLTNLPGDEVVLQLADASRAGVMVPVEQPEGEEALMLLMPMMLND